eukprot:gene1700-13215_t
MDQHNLTADHFEPGAAALHVQPFSLHQRTQLVDNIAAATASQFEEGCRKKKATPDGVAQKLKLPPIDAAVLRKVYECARDDGADD